MRPYHLGRSARTIVASNRAVSLTGSLWKCLQQEAWNEEQSVFFAECPDFYHHTISKDAPQYYAVSSSKSKIKESCSWIIAGTDHRGYARVRLQIIQGDYHHGLLFIDVETAPLNFNLAEVASQLITANFISYQLDTMKVVTMNELAETVMDQCCLNFKKHILSASTHFTPEMDVQTIYDLEFESWQISAAGAKSLLDLNWLKRRVEREASLAALKSKDVKRPWLLNLLSLGRRRRTSEKMTHPLDKIRGID